MYWAAPASPQLDDSNETCPDILLDCFSNPSLCFQNTLQMYHLFTLTSKTQFNNKQDLTSNLLNLSNTEWWNQTILAIGLFCVWVGIMFVATLPFSKSGGLVGPAMWPSHGFCSTPVVESYDSQLGNQRIPLQAIATSHKLELLFSKLSGWYCTELRVPKVLNSWFRTWKSIRDQWKELLISTSWKLEVMILNVLLFRFLSW